MRKLIIAGRWNLESTTIKISAESLYRWIYKQKPFYYGGILIDLRKWLVRARKIRGLKRKTLQSKIKERVSVHERPDHINKRMEVGHYERDLYGIAVQVSCLEHGDATKERR